MKRIKFLLLLTGIVLCFVLVGCAKSNGEKTGKSNSFTYWIPQGIDTSYYSTYDQNPGVKYLTGKTWGEDNAKLNLEFVVPMTGSEKSNFNTLLASGDYADIMTLTYCDESITTMYQDGVVLDLTEYVEKYMPNYMAFLDAHPDLKMTATANVDGEKKFLQLYNFSDGPGDNWGGYEYRRDWIIKYGKNPEDGSSFSGSYTGKNEDGSVDVLSWEDNVVFPSGNTDPIYISDWEWMLDIFATAIKDQNITDGYPMSLYYPGYTETGELVSGFGGGGAAWYKNKEGNIVFGGNTDDFRTYLQCMNTWYKNGWIDTAFTEHSTDMFYQIDLAKVMQGKIGLWYGMSAQLEGKLDNGQGLTDGIVIFAARQPINDIYGTDAQKNNEPYCMFTTGGAYPGTAISDKAKDKNIPALLTMFDYMYTQEGSFLATFGLNKEQYEETQDEFYTKNGLTEGSYMPSSVTDDGKQRYSFVPQLLNEGGMLVDAVRCIRIVSLDSVTLKDEARTLSLRNNLNQWIWYPNTGLLNTTFTDLLSPEGEAEFSKNQTYIREFMSKGVPRFIKGTEDPYSDDDWNNYVKAISKYNPDANTKIYQDLLDSLN